MRSMMQRVVLEGTGRKAILEGYSAAGKTGTAQKVDPATGAYSKTKYVGSFAGFAPVNNPQIVVAVILDSAVGLHQGGQVSAPVFRRVAQQALEYLHVPHDLPLAPQHQLLLASAKARDKDLEEGTPDHPGEPLETAEVNGDSSEPASGGPGVAQAPVRQAQKTPLTANAAADGHIVREIGLGEHAEGMGGLFVDGTSYWLGPEQQGRIEQHALGDNTVLATFGVVPSAEGISIIGSTLWYTSYRQRLLAAIVRDAPSSIPRIRRFAGPADRDLVHATA